jgi:hypothetical protein
MKCPGASYVRRRSIDRRVHLVNNQIAHDLKTRKNADPEQWEGALKKAIERAGPEERPKILDLDFLKKSGAQRFRALKWDYRQDDDEANGEDCAVPIGGPLSAWVISGHFAAQSACLLYPRSRPAFAGRFFAWICESDYFPAHVA